MSAQAEELEVCENGERNRGREQGEQGADGELSLSTGLALQNSFIMLYILSDIYRIFSSAECVGLEDKGLI